MITTTHLNLPGTARQALDFYARVFDGQATYATYGQMGMPADAPGADRIVFGQVESAGGFRIMAYDVPGLEDASAGTTRREHGTTITDRPFFQSLRVETMDELAGYWDALAEGATIVEPLAASAWSAGFGMLTDRFGVTWVMDVQAS